MQNYKDKIKKQKIAHNNDQSQNLRLSQQNLVPVYLIEDNMKNNFTLIERAINDHNRSFKRFNERIIQNNMSIQKLDQKFMNKIKQTECQIHNTIKKDLEGIVTMIINRHLKVVLEKFQQQQQKQNTKETILDEKMKTMQKQLSYQVAQQNQKYFVKQITKINKQFDKKIQTSLKKNDNIKTHQNSKRNNKQQNFVIQKNSLAVQQNKNIVNNIQIDRFEEKLSEMKIKIEQIQNFNSNLDKKFSDEFQSLRQNWKQVGSQLLDNKKIVNKKIDSLNSDVILLKTGSEFSHMPLNMQQSFKKTIIQKFTQVYRVMSSLTTHSQFQSTNQRNRRILNRYNQQLIALRNEQYKNTQFFTVYMNNSKSQDLTQQIHKIRNDMINDKQYLEAIFENLRNKDETNSKMIEELGKNIGAIQIEKQNIQKKVFSMNLHTQNLIEKVKVLEDLNHISPQKMRKIHDTLDKGFSSYSYETSPQKLRNKQVYAEIAKLKDQIFLLSSQHNIHGIQKQDIISQLKNEIKKVHQKIQQMKNDSQQGAITRKPWVCLSCDKQKMNKKIQDTFHKSASKKKVSLQIGKSGGFLTNRSQKNITFKLSNAHHVEEKFEIYQKFRQKYLTDTLKLPEIYKQKIGSLQSELM